VATLIEVDDLQDGYLNVVNTVLTKGQRRSPRGMPTLDMSNVIIQLKNPARAIPIGVGRNPNLRIGAAEVAQFIAGVSHPAMLSTISQNFTQFIEYDRMYGAYGPRVYAQFPSVIAAFNRDINTRQAGVGITRPDDVMISTRDVPCTLDVRFAISTQGKLDCCVVMRSNDVVWGLTYDAWVFTAAQHAVAYALGVPVGEYTHHALSLHIYDQRDQKIIERLHPYDGTAHPPYPIVPLKIGNLEPQVRNARWKYIRNILEAVVGVRDVAESHHRMTNVMWYHEQLRGTLHRDTHSLCPTCRCVLPLWYFYPGNRSLCRWCDKDVRARVPIGTYARMMLVQSGLCAICGADQDLVLDHCHETGVARGLLCQSCNKALGLMYDKPVNLIRAAQYLEPDVDANTWTTDFPFLYRARPREIGGPTR
jgi:thymidylate synthase